MEQTFGKLKDLKPGQTLLLDARKVANGKIQLQFAEMIQTSDRPISLLGILNRNDPSFASRARRCWVTADADTASEDFKFNFEDDNENWIMDEKGELIEVNLLNPVINDSRVRLSVQETVTPTEWQQANIERAAKKRGKNGTPITHQGNYIFSNTVMVLTNDEVKHTFLTSDDNEVKIETKDEVITENKVGDEVETNLGF